ncbi:MAG: lipoprotein [Pseudomonadota bacterium]
MRFIVTAILLCGLLQACGSKGALYLPPDKGGEQQSNSNKQH